MRTLTTLLVVAMFAFGAPGRAQEPYAGVVPGSGQEPPRLVAARRSAGNVVTWPGFQMLEGGRSRFFVQSTAPVAHRLEPTAGRIVVWLTDAQLHLRNTRLPLETRFFDTPVERAYLERRGRDLAFVLVLRPGVSVTPTVRTESAGAFHYLYVELPDGSWVETPRAPATISPEEQRELDAMDDEAPPDLGEVGPAGR